MTSGFPQINHYFKGNSRTIIALKSQSKLFNLFQRENFTVNFSSHISPTASLHNLAPLPSKLQLQEFYRRISRGTLLKQNTTKGCPLTVVSDFFLSFKLSQCRERTRLCQSQPRLKRYNIRHVANLHPKTNLQS